MNRLIFKNRFLAKILCLVLFSFLLILPSTAFSANPSVVVTKVTLNEKIMALTFDAGSNAGFTSEILNTLAKYEVKSTFFLTGKYAELYPGLTKDILKQGHEIGNHSYSHPYFTKISTAEMKGEVKKTHDIILRITGKAPAPLFRPPYGNYNSDVLKALGEMGYSHTIMWSTDTLDWKGIPAESIIKRVLDNAKPGAVVLMHVGSGTHTPEALPIIIEKLHSMGYKLTTVSNMLSKDNPSPTGKTYTVAPGDTLWKIASMFGVTVSDLVEINEIPNQNLIYPGQLLNIPTKDITYTVKRGDNLWAIANKFSTTVSNLVKLNNIKNPDMIYPEQILLIK